MASHDEPVLLRANDSILIYPFLFPGALRYRTDLRVVVVRLEQRSWWTKRTQFLYENLLENGVENGGHGAARLTHAPAGKPDDVVMIRSMLDRSACDPSPDPKPVPPSQIPT